MIPRFARESAIFKAANESFEFLESHDRKQRFVNLISILLLLLYPAAAGKSKRIKIKNGSSLPAARKILCGHEFFHFLFPRDSRRA